MSRIEELMFTHSCFILLILFILLFCLSRIWKFAPFGLV
jgi:hypothetical protein